MAASCYSTALFSLPRTNPRYGLLLSSSASLLKQNNRLGLSLRTETRLEARKSVRVSCIGDGKTEVVTGKSWDKLILESETPVLVEFYTSWCGPCRMVHRVIDEIANDYSGRLNCFVIDADRESQIAEKYEIKAVPVVLLFKNGKKCGIVVGTMPKEFYIDAIERAMAS